MNPNLEEKKFSAEHRMADLIENALLHGIFGGRTASRREFFKLVGGATALAIIEEVLPLSTMKAWAAETGSRLPWSGYNLLARPLEAKVGQPPKSLIYEGRTTLRSRIFA